MRRVYEYNSNSNEYRLTMFGVCEACGERFELAKGYLLADGFLTCYKHLSDIYLKEKGFK